MLHNTAKGMHLIIVLWLLSACGSSSTPIPTAIPEPTPATAQERINIYDKHLRWHVSLLLQSVEEIEQYPNSASKAFSSALGASISFTGLMRLVLPSKSDFVSIGSDFDPKINQEFILEVLAPCKQLGSIAMSIEVENIDAEALNSLLDANTACKTELLYLKDEFPRLFDCPIEMGLCTQE